MLLHVRLTILLFVTKRTFSPEVAWTAFSIIIEMVGTWHDRRRRFRVPKVAALTRQRWAGRDPSDPAGRTADGVHGLLFALAVVFVLGVLERGDYFLDEALDVVLLDGAGSEGVSYAGLGEHEI